MNTERTKMTNELLKNKITVLKDVISCLEEIVEQPEKGGITSTSICAKYEINFLSIRKLINLTILDNMYIDKVIDHKDIVIDKTPYEKIFHIILDIPDNEVVIMPADLEDSVKYAIDNYLTEREKYVLYERFGIDSYCRTYNEIGDEMKCCRTRVKQIEVKAIRKLRTNNLAVRIIKDGLTEFRKNDKITTTIIELEKPKIKEKKKRKVTSETLLSDSTVDIELKKKLLMDILEYCTKDTMSDVIWSTVDRFRPNDNDDGLIRRLNNCIARQCDLNYNMTFLLFTNDFEFSKMRNFGKKTLDLLNIICDDYISQFNTSREEVVSAINGGIYENMSAFLRDYIIAKRISFEQEGKDLLKQIDDIAKVVNIGQFYGKSINTYTSHWFSTPNYEWNSNTVYDYISKSPLYFSVKNYKYLKEFTEKILPICNEFLSYFNIKHKDYLEMALIVCTDNNREEFIKYNKMVRDFVYLYMDKNFNFDSLSQLCVEKQVDACAGIIINEIDNKIPNTDPNIIYTFVIECIREHL